MREQRRNSVDKKGPAITEFYSKHKQQVNIYNQSPYTYLLIIKNRNRATYLRPCTYFPLNSVKIVFKKRFTVAGFEP